MPEELRDLSHLPTLTDWLIRRDAMRTFTHREGPWGLRAINRIVDPIARDLREWQEKD